jgi:tetratricopeptide (TPR) repeat protein
MKFFLFFLLISSSVCFSQENSFQALLDSGKAEYKREYPKQQPSYTRALEYLEKAVTLDPKSAEARYFLGYTLDKLNADDAEKMNVVSLALTKKASEQFEEVNKIEPSYTGEILVLDPYTKITSIWGSLAFSYLNTRKKDSAVWALKEGHRRGGFMQSILPHQNWVLSVCKPNAIVFVAGDLTTFSLLYLQQIEHLREDVTVVDISLLHSTWYPKYLKESQRLSMSYSQDQLDTLSYRVWHPTPIAIKDPSTPKRRLEWMMKPTYYDSFILRGDLVRLDIVKQEYYNRELYFLNSFDSTEKLFLDDFLVYHGPLFHLTTYAVKFPEMAPLSTGLKSFTIDQVMSEEAKKSPDALADLNRLRTNYLQLAHVNYETGNQREALRLYEELEKKLPVDLYPYVNEQVKEYAAQVKATISK